MISSHYLPFLLFSHSPFVATCSCFPRPYIRGGRGWSSNPLFLLLINRAQQEHPYPYCLACAWFWAMGQALGTREGRDSSSLSWLASIRLQSPLTPDTQLGEKPQRIVTATNPLPTAHPIPLILGHPDLWL